MNQPKPMRLGDLLVSARVITEEQLHIGLEEQRRYGGRLGSTFVRLGFVSEDLLVKALARHLQIADVDPLLAQPPTAILARFPKESWVRMRVFPVGFDDQRRVLVLATFDPLNRPVLDEISRIIGTSIEPRIASESRILAALQRAFSGGIHDGGALPAFQILNGIEEAARSNMVAVLSLLEIAAEKGLCSGAESASRSQHLKSQLGTRSAPKLPQR